MLNIIFNLQRMENSVRFYKNIRKTDENQLELLEQELSNVKNAAVDDVVEPIPPNSFQWADFKTKHARKALVIGMVLMVLNACNGVAFITSYSLPVFGMHMRPSWAMFIARCMSLLGACVTILLDRVGQKVYNMHTCILFGI